MERFTEEEYLKYLSECYPEPREEVLIGALGICEHCGAILNIQDISSEGMNAEWRCPDTSCNGIITYKSFGYEETKGRQEKKRWVGPGGQWAKKRPTQDFKLGNLDVQVVTIPRSF